MKIAKKVVIKPVDFRVWCEHCSIRIAPNEEQTVVSGKAYHVGCHSKVKAVLRPKT